MSNLWNNPIVNDAIKSLSDEDKLKYKRIGQDLYNTIDFIDPKAVEIDYAGHIALMLRDGMAAEDLLPEEREMYVNVYGLKSLDAYKKCP